MKPRAPRFPVSLFIGEADKSTPLGRSRDVSLSGVFVETPHRPDIDTHCEIWFVWGEDIYSANAKIVRHADDGIGVTFIDPDPLFLRVLQEITGDDDETPPPLAPLS